jgi:hypothetical protein
LEQVKSRSFRDQGGICKVYKKRPSVKMQPLAHLGKRKRKNYGTQAVKITPHINKGKATLVPSTVKFLHHKKERKNQ